ncbi:MAG: sodium:calcium antiporter [Nanoarchaeota archaeon]
MVDSSIAIHFGAILLSLFLIVKSSDTLVRSSLRVSKRYHVSQFIMGLVFVSIGTSLPELFTSSVGSLLAQSSVSIGTIIGANMINICILLGTAIMLTPEHQKAKEWAIQGMILIAATLLFVTFLYDGLSRFEGMLLLILFTLYVYGLFYTQKRNLAKEADITKKSEIKLLHHPILTLALSSAGIALGAVWLVKAIQNISLEIGISQSLIAAFVVALGTTMPELSVTLQSIKHRAYGVLLGNIVGSNITNILLIGGIASFLRPFPPPETAVLFMIPFFVFAPLLAMLYLTRTVPRIFGLALIMFYLVFVLFAAFSIPFLFFA